jgi:hypothetical protein
MEAAKKAKRNRELRKMQEDVAGAWPSLMLALAIWCLIKSSCLPSLT